VIFTSDLQGPAAEEAQEAPRHYNSSGTKEVTYSIQWINIHSLLRVDVAAVVIFLSD